MELLLFILTGFGVTTIITKSEIFSPIRETLDTGHNTLKSNFFGFLIGCPLCVGFWVGVFQSLMFFSPVFEGFGLETFSILYYIFLRTFSIILDGALVGGIVWSIHIYLDLMQSKAQFFETKEMYYTWLAAQSEEENRKQIL